MTVGQVSLAAGETDSGDPVRVEAVAARDAPARHEQETAVTDAPLTLLVQPAGGSARQLAYLADDGWTLDDRNAVAQRTEAHVTSAAVSQLREEAVAIHPLAVFIDGPTGYTYVWIRDQGWKFVGRVVDRKK
ncbi:hypothetical protein [Paraburkholderia sp. 2C]